MSINLNKQISLSHPDGHIHDNKDDSFDYELSLLESTLTEINEEDHLVDNETMPTGAVNKLNVIITDPVGLCDKSFEETTNCHENDIMFTKSCDTDAFLHREINEYIALPNQPVKFCNLSPTLHCKGNIPEDKLPELNSNEIKLPVENKLNHDTTVKPCFNNSTHCNIQLNNIVTQRENYFEEGEEDFNSPSTALKTINKPIELLTHIDDAEMSSVTNQMTIAEMLKVNDQEMLEIGSSPILSQETGFKETEICCPVFKTVLQASTGESCLSDGENTIVDVKETCYFNCNTNDDKNRCIIPKNVTDNCEVEKDFLDCSQPAESYKELTAKKPDDGKSNELLPYYPLGRELSNNIHDCGKTEVNSSTDIYCRTLVYKQAVMDQKQFESDDDKFNSHSYPKMESIIDIDNVSDKFENTEIKSSIYCSTPVSKSLVTDKKLTPNLDTCEFDGSEGISPFTKTSSREKLDLKRKLLGLDCIQEVDEDESDVGAEKKPKLDRLEDSNINNDENASSSSMPVYEAPAKSILKKWQPSCLSRNSTQSYLVLDECGESDDGSKHDTDNEEGDDFEEAYKSLTEELKKSTSNMETLEKYHSQLQLENQMDDDKFDELLQELISICDADDVTSTTLKSMEMSLNEGDKTLTPKSIAECEVTKIEIQDSLVNSSLSKVNTTVVELKKEGDETDISIGKDNMPYDQNVLKLEKVIDTIETNKASEKKSIAEKQESKPRKDEVDEEDILLDQREYEFVEYVSNDPKENEDNYNPEWQKLGRLTSDEERYKAVRDRWRSLVPPDPHRNLTCRQWRQKNKKETVLSNNNSIWNPAESHQQHSSSERNIHCATIFDNKIKKMVRELEQSRKQILIQRETDFEQLAVQQDSAQRRMMMMGFTGISLTNLHKQHIEECRVLKNQHDQKIKRITDSMEEKIRVLKNAGEEVVWFQQFYKGVGDESDNVCLYMTADQVQELQETEDMLDNYTTMYYRG